MLSKSDLLSAILKECHICVHLFDKIPDGKMDYRPTPKQRSTFELLQYLTYCASGFTDALITGNWDGYGKFETEAASMTADQFPVAMEHEMQRISRLFESISDNDFSTKEVETMSGEKMKLGQGLLEITYRFISSYRMQLFLYAKASGNENIWTPDCWEGVDVERKR